LYNETKRKKSEKNVYLEERRQTILDLVQDEGRVAVSDLSDRFGVSEVTIRADLKALADQGWLLRTHGGAIPMGYGLQELSLTRRRQQRVAEKARIAAAAAALIDHGEAIFLDSSSTTLAIVDHIKHRRDLTVITNSLVVAQEMLGLPNVTLVMPGGTLHHDTASLIDAGGLALLKRYRISTGFFGAHGLTVEDGLTDVSEPEANLKRPLARMCREVIALLDETKWGRAGVASFASVDDIDRVITTGDASESLVEAVRALGVDVVRV
jgi:DeoR family transcriptional regulator, aga operon transcriptional repressor